MPTKAPSTVSKRNSNMQKGNIAKDTDWLLHQNSIEQVFSDWHDDSADVDQLWPDIKNTVNKSWANVSGLQNLQEWQTLLGK